MRLFAQPLMLVVYALEIEKAWDRKRYEKLDKIFEKASKLRGTSSPGLARAVLNGR